MPTGIVRRFVDYKGYGFIQRDDDGTDLFVHYSSIVEDFKPGFKTLFEGQRVEFDIVTTEKGPCAANVTVLEEEVKDGS